MDIFENAVAALGATTLNRYRLDIPSCTSPLDVESLRGDEGISRTYRYTITFTSTDHDIDAAQLLRKPVTLTMGTGLLQSLTTQKVVHGVITDLQRISGSADEAKYRLTLEPSLALLDKQFRTHRFFVNKSVQDVVAQILEEHGFKGWEYEFALKQTYPKREQINQYHESDLAFIERLLSEVGIFYFFSLQPDTQTEVVHFADKQSAYAFGKTLPLSSPSGMSDSGAESVWGLSVQHNVVPASVTAKDYNFREAQKVNQSAKADMTRGDGEGINYGDVYHYKPRHLDSGAKTDPSAETGNFMARLDHERFLSAQTLITGNSTDATLHPAQVLTVADVRIPSTLPELLSLPMVVTRIGFTASRKEALNVTFAAVPFSETLCWRPALMPRPKVSGTMMARVTSAKPNDIYAWQDNAGLYRVKFDADQDDKKQGQESMPVRFAKPNGGDEYGIHFPLIQGTEVAIAFHDGDPDRPYIAHALHDSRHVDHVTEKNNTRNVIRTPANNKLRMEDKRGEEHIKLSTEYGGKTQLNLGHNVDAARAKRGEGFELRTDEWGALRAGKGIFISADAQPAASGKQLEMDDAIAQLEQALTLARTLAKAAQIAKATPGDINSQKALNASLAKLKAAGILMSAPQGIGIVSPKSVRVASGSESIGMMSGSNTDISSGKSFTAVAGESVSLLAQKAGMKLLAGQGKVDIQAQDDELSALAKNDITVTSAEGKITVTASKELILTCGGGYIKLSGGNIEIADPQNILFKSANWQKMGPASLNTPPVTFPKGYGAVYALQDEEGKAIPLTEYRITTAEGTMYAGVSDKNGKTAPVYTAAPGRMNIEILGTK
ncbi:type VI secretion system Vgr family protein [Rahnella sikkimica]|uniref:Type IV secretion protein Rhs n=1 Tax=Rahnella sikkimica TaxID=1805933 RepID=A0A2L1UX71_9GAMM|nr:type VI secretion system Vgr family protein [Rahnella sikkimica]AVF37525.1 type IV secretion protein Rhs [Rahnella sikkimica]